MPYKGRHQRLLTEYTFVCPMCEIHYHPYRPNQQTCSAQCRNALTSKKTGKIRAVLQRKRGNNKTYKKLDGRHLHRVIAEEKIGRPLAPGEIVHHVDGNKINNDPANLEVLTSQSVHARLHFIEIWESRYGYNS